MCGRAFVKSTFADLLAPFPLELMKIWPVSTRVNSVRNQEADLLDPVEPEEPGLLYPSAGAYAATRLLGSASPEIT